ncbi:TPA: iron ABC transporter substrate-binding protein [Methanosarcina acetivorans]|nr:iron ABC transporter substrate-binding protein [Methanosarcina acetivorans]HIH94383.1 iron ABC transporter substrate-binding protein [Methanosarcina acetivorans]
MFALTVVFSGCISQSSPEETSISEEKNTVTVQDSAGRYVEVPYPVEKIVVLWDNPPEELRSLGAIDRIVGIDAETKKKVDSGFFPELADVPVVGTWDEPDYEKIAELNPDVVIMLSSYPPLPDDVQKKLEPFGIAVVGLDFYMVDSWEREVRTLGFMLGEDEKADEYIRFFTDEWAMIKERTKDIPDDEKKKVYFEGLDPYLTYGGADYGCGIPGMVRAAGGIDLFPEISAYSFEVDPEEISLRNPDVILKGTASGYLSNASEFSEIQQGVASRPELTNTNAVKNSNVFVISWEVAAGSRKKFGPMYLAKALYPERFEDYDPDLVTQKYFEDYQGINYQGIYFYPSLNASLNETENTDLQNVSES